MAGEYVSRLYFSAVKTTTDWHYYYLDFHSQLIAPIFGDGSGRESFTVEATSLVVHYNTDLSIGRHDLKELVFSNGLNFVTFK